MNQDINVFSALIFNMRESDIHVSKRQSKISFGGNQPSILPSKHAQVAWQDMRKSIGIQACFLSFLKTGLQRARRLLSPRPRHGPATGPCVRDVSMLLCSVRGCAMGVCCV